MRLLKQEKSEQDQGYRSLLPAVEERVEPQETTAQAPVRRSGSGRAEAALRVGLVCLALIGSASLLIPPLTGVPLTGWIEAMDLRAAYSSANVAAQRADLDIAAGRLGPALKNALSLPVGHDRREELLGLLAGKLLAAKQYEDATAAALALQDANRRVDYLSAVIGGIAGARGAGAALAFLKAHGVSQGADFHGALVGGANVLVFRKGSEAVIVELLASVPPHLVVADPVRQRAASWLANEGKLEDALAVARNLTPGAKRQDALNLVGINAASRADEAMIERVLALAETVKTRDEWLRAWASQAQVTGKTEVARKLSARISGAKP